MTVKLWDYFYPQVSLIVYLVHNENEDTTKLEHYQATIRKLVPRYALIFVKETFHDSAL